MRCLVTGASGHLGAFLTRQLLAAGAEVHALVRPTSDLWRLADVLGQVRLIRADLATIGTAAAAIEAAAPEVVFHLAWGGVLGEYRNDRAQITANVTGSLALFELTLAAGCSCWIGVGSQAEYGPVGGVLTEDTVPNPATAYGVAKFGTGLLLRKLCELAGIRYAWVRLLAVYGPQDDPRHLIPAVIGQLLDGERPALTLGEQRWDYLYVEDAAEALLLLAQTPTAHGVFNLGAGHADTVRAMVERIRDMIDPALPLGFGELPYRPDQVMHLMADIGRLRDMAGWRPRTGLDAGLRATIAWTRAARLR